MTGSLTASEGGGPAKRQVHVTMRCGRRRLLPSVTEVSGLLDIAVRELPGVGPASSVSVTGLWSCLGARDEVGPWFASKVHSCFLVEDRDWFGDAVGDHAGVYMHVLSARFVIAATQTKAGITAVNLIDAAFRASQSETEDRRVADLLCGIAGRSRGAAAQGPDAGTIRGADAHEPWAEAFDFGRIVPVMDREIGGVVQLSVSARDVHTFFGVGRDFTKWIKGQMKRCSLVEGVDAQSYNLAKSGEVVRTGPAPTDYTLTLLAAKKVAMAAAGPRGAAVREYFIECERRLLAGEGPIPGSIDPAPVAVLPPDWRASLVADRSAQPSMPDRSIPLTMVEFLRLVGFDRGDARALAAEHGPVLLRRMMLDGEGMCVGRHPVLGVICFARPILDAWWMNARPLLLAELPARD